MNLGIPKTETEKTELLDLCQRRYLRANQNCQPWMENAVRYYKIYRAMADAALDEDEPNTFLPYAYGLVEQIVYKISEPILKMVPPCRVIPKKFGQDEMASKFEQIARNYYTASPYQLEYINSCREQTIVGSAWEMDTWYQDYVKARRWTKVQRQAPLTAIRGMNGSPLALKDDATYDYTDQVEEEYMHPEKIGYGIEFPSFFDVLPEDPGIKSIEKQHWIIHDIRSIAVDDLQKQMFTDPQTGEKRPAFDLTELLKDAGEHRPGAIAPMRAWQQYDFGKQSRDIVNATLNDSERQAYNDVDRVWLINIYEPNRIVSVAQGKYIVRVINDPWQKPKLRWRIRNYTQDTQFLFGIGAIQPIEDMLYELNDVHNLSMSNWVRIVNKMVVYNEGAIPYPDDFKPSALGRIRVKNNMDVRAAIMEVPHTDPAPSMLAMESNAKGLIEWASSVSDLAPGPGGQKQGHKTASGLIQIQQNLATRFSVVHRQQLANAQKQMTSMEEMLSQFQFDKAPYRIYRNDGTTLLSEFSKEDIDTQGLGFDYVIEIDPSFGDDMVRLNQLLALFDQALKYEGWRTKMGGPNAKQMNISDVMASILPRFGFSNTSRIFQLPNGVKEPGQELELIARGQPVQVQPGENMIAHLLQHMQDVQNPNLQKAIAAGKADPRTIEWLTAHIQETQAAINATLQNPQFAMQKKGQGTVPGLS